MAFLNHVQLQNSSEVVFKTEKPNFNVNQRLNLITLLKKMINYDCREARAEVPICEAVNELFEGFPFQEVDCAKYLMTETIGKTQILAERWVIKVEHENQSVAPVIKFFYKDWTRKLIPITSIKAKVKLPFTDYLTPSYSEWTPKHISHTYEEVTPPNDDKQNNSKSKISIEAEKLTEADGLSPSYSWCTPHIDSHKYEKTDVLRDDNQVNSKPKTRIEVDERINPEYSLCTIVTSKDSVPIKVDKKGSESKTYESNRPQYTVVTTFKPKPSK